MNPLIIALHDKQAGSAFLCGNKAATLHHLINHNIKVPNGLCVTRYAYQQFIQKTGVEHSILMELGRKNFQNMRWEELWDASLRIKNAFLKEKMPGPLQAAIVTALKAHDFSNKAVAVRSSSDSEDSNQSSFAGIHQSFVHIVGIGAILDHIKQVWASLWSDAALAYQKELALNVGESTMAVLIQEFISGRKSGIAFSSNPNNANQAVIEAVYGLNKGLVDGDIEPDRYFLDWNTGQIISQSNPAARHYCVVDPKGTKIIPVPPPFSNKSVLNPRESQQLFYIMKKIADYNRNPQDIEWTLQQDHFYILQSRPITTAISRQEQPTRRTWDLSLRRSYHNLVELAQQIEHNLIPAMMQEANQLTQKNLNTLNTDQLCQEIKIRKDLLEKWNQSYWDTFIPFAHGMRLFGDIYNRRLKPNDPYEFIALISSNQLISIQRNKRLEKLAKKVRKNPDLLNQINSNSTFRQEINGFLKEISTSSCHFNACLQEKENVLHLLGEMAKIPGHTVKQPDKKTMTQRYYQSFSPDEQDFAKSLLDLGRKSYRLRDDDNIYLGRFETLLQQAIQVYQKRKSHHCKMDPECQNLEEKLFSNKKPHFRSEEKETSPLPLGEKGLHIRQLRGQPAGSGLAKGFARVIKHTSDLGQVKKDEIIVCDAIDPNMTFVIPIVKAIVERRGGMLIHGAIIAREYGLPCVTGIPEATNIIHTGDLITVDGYFGLVIIHQKDKIRKG